MPDLSFAPGVWREECVQSDHAFDAIICAYTGYLLGARRLDGARRRVAWSPRATAGSGCRPSRRALRASRGDRAAASDRAPPPDAALISGVSRSPALSR